MHEEEEEEEEEEVIGDKSEMLNYYPFLCTLLLQNLYSCLCEGFLEGIPRATTRSVCVCCRYTRYNVAFNLHVLYFIWQI